MKKEDYIENIREFEQRVESGELNTIDDTVRKVKKNKLKTIHVKRPPIKES